MDAAVGMNPGLGELTIRDVRTFLGLPSKQVTKSNLSGNVDEAVKIIAIMINGLLLNVIEKRNPPDFHAAVTEAFPNYARLMMALSGIVTSMVPVSVIERVAAESFSELEADIREHAAIAFGSDVQKQAMFTVWTLRKINDLSQQISVADKVAENLKERDVDFARNFAFHVLRARFNLDCLTLSMHSQGRYRIYPEVLDVVTDGLRSVVNAYAWIRQGADLRIPAEEPTLVSVEWDEEDQCLLEASMRELTVESI